MTPSLSAALRDLTARIAADPGNAWLYHDRASLHRQARQWRLARADLDRAVELDPDEFEFWLSRGVFQGRLGGGVVAIEADFARAIALQPANPRGYSLQGRYFHSWHQSQEAVAAFDRAIELEPSNALHFADRGDAFAAMGELARALDDYAAAIHLDPTQGSFFSRRADARLRSNPDVYPEDSLLDLDAAICREPDQRWYRVDRGYVRFCLGDWRGAVEDFACPDIPAIYSPTWKHGGARLATWSYLAWLFVGEDAVGKQIVAGFLRWYEGEVATDPELWTMGTLGDWPILVAQFLVGQIAEQQVHEVLTSDLANPDHGSYERAETEVKVKEFRFVLGERLLAAGQGKLALPHLEAACDLPAHDPMRWVATRQVVGLRPGKNS